MRISISKIFQLFRNRHIPFVSYCACWLFGILISHLVFQFARPVLLSVMPGITRGALSIIGCVFVAFLPFLITGFAVYFHIPGLIYPLCIFRSFIGSITALSIMFMFGSGGWLMHFLLCFSQNCSSVLLLFFWMYRCYYSKQATKVYWFCFCFTMLLGIFDLLVISPFAAGITTY